MVPRVAGVLALLIAGVACSSAASSAGARRTVESSSSTTATTATTAAADASDTALASLGIKHVFVIVLENESYADSYVHNKHPYLGKTLPALGTLLTDYYAIGHSSLDNYIAMISGQAPNTATSADCHQYTDFNNTRAAASLNADGQAVGTGCIYPSNVPTLANQLSTAGVTWHGFMEGMGNDKKREQSTCGVPSVTSTHGDETQLATTTDQYVARHNPFVYFRAVIGSPICKQNVVPLSRLTTAIKRASTTPAFTFITPDLCDDGHDSPCVGKDSKGSSQGGLASVDDFLSTWIPKLRKSAGYKDGGVILITSDESQASDTSSCCNERPGPSDSKPGVSGPGGGRVGTLVIGKCVARGVKDPTPYNHYSLLRSLEDIFGITTGGTDGHGHLGYAAAAGLHPFGSDLFSRCASP